MCKHTWTARYGFNLILIVVCTTINRYIIECIHVIVIDYLRNLYKSYWNLSRKHGVHTVAYSVYPSTDVSSRYTSGSMTRCRVRQRDCARHRHKVTFTALTVRCSAHNTFYKQSRAAVMSRFIAFEKRIRINRERKNPIQSTTVYKSSYLITGDIVRVHLDVTSSRRTIPPPRAPTERKSARKREGFSKSDVIRARRRRRGRGHQAYRGNV